MEDDDEFGDLYTDVLLPFAASAPPPQQASAAPAETSQTLRRPIDLNNLHDGDEDDDDDIDVFRAPASSLPGVTVAQTLALDSAVAEPRGGAGEGSNLREDEVTFDIEEANSVAEEVIPGLGGSPEDAEASRRDDGGGGEDWDSDSEDDLQIVLNGPMTMERGGGIGDDDDEDEDELVIVADGDPSGAMEPQEWGEDGAQAADGERKEIGEAGKAGPGGMVAAAKVSYVGHGFHPFHSQFKVSVLI